MPINLKITELLQKIISLFEEQNLPLFIINLTFTMQVAGNDKVNISWFHSENNPISSRNIKGELNIKLLAEEILTCLLSQEIPIKVVAITIYIHSDLFDTIMANNPYRINRDMARANFERDSIDCHIQILRKLSAEDLQSRDH